MKIRHVIAALTVCLSMIFSIPSVMAAELVTPEDDAEVLANELLSKGTELVPGSAVLKFAGPENVQSGIFTGGKELIGIDSGVVLSTGYCIYAMDIPDIGTSVATEVGTDDDAKDPDLEKIAEVNICDTVSLEFSVIASSDQLKFNYVFNTGEFDQDVEYNDLFGLFVKKGDGDFKNIAFLPDCPEKGDYKMPVTTENIRRAIDSGRSDLGSYGMFTTDGSEGYGQTSVYTAQTEVTPGEKITLKFVIADASDGDVNSNVYIEAESVSFEEEPIAPAILEIKANGIKVDAVEGQEYSIDGEKWQTDGMFTNLNPETEYTIVTRHVGGKKTQSTDAKTLAASPATGDTGITAAMMAAALSLTGAAAVMGLMACKRRNKA